MNDNSEGYEIGERWGDPNHGIDKDYTNRLGEKENVTRSFEEEFSNALSLGVEALEILKSTFKGNHEIERIEAAIKSLKRKRNGEM